MNLEIIGKYDHNSYDLNIHFVADKMNVMDMHMYICIYMYNYSCYVHQEHMMR